MPPKSVELLVPATRPPTAKELLLHTSGMASCFERAGYPFSGPYPRNDGLGVTVSYGAPSDNIDCACNGPVDPLAIAFAESAEPTEAAKLKSMRRSIAACLTGHGVTIPRSNYPDAALGAAIDAHPEQAATCIEVVS